MSELDALIAEAELGLEADKFLKSDLGRCIIGMARQEVERAMKEFAVTDLTDKTKVENLQRQIRLYDDFEQWLIELVQNGENAMSIYKQSQETK